MAGILRPGPNALWRTGQIKPVGIPRIDWTHPLTENLVSYWWDLGVGAYIDLVSGHTTLKDTVSVLTVRKSSPFGDGTGFTTNTGSIHDPASYPIQTWAAPYTIAAGWYQLGATGFSADPGYFGIFDSSGNNGPAIFGPSATTFGCSLANQVSSYSFTYVANTLYVVVGAATGASASSHWVNGIAQTAGTTTTAFSGAGLGVEIGGPIYNNGQPSNPNSIIFFGAIWTRALNASEARLLYTDPYCFLLPPEGEMPALRSPTVQLPFTQTDWPLPAPPRPTIQQFITFRQTGMLGQDRLPIRQQDWPNPIPPFRLEQTIVWNQTGMFGQDKLPNRQQDWPNPVPPFRPEQTIVWNQTGMFGQDRLPNRQQDWPLPIIKITPSPIEQTITWRQTGMLGKDILPFRNEQWSVPTPPFRMERTWLWRQTGMFGQDTLPNRQQDWPNPTSVTWYRDWSLADLLTTTLTATTVLPFNQYQWLVPTPPSRLDLTWTWRQTGMLGQDQLPNRQQDWPLPTPPSRPDCTWVFYVNNPPVLLFIPGVADWPLPERPPLQPPDFIPYNVALRAVVQAPVPFRQQDWPLPTPPFRPDFTWIWYAVNPPSFMPGDSDWPLPERQPSQTPDFIPYNVALLSAVQAPLPFNQFDWPNPRAPLQSPPTITWRQTGMFGQDTLPFRQQDWRNPVPVVWYQDWSRPDLLIGTLAPVFRPPFTQYDWPLPQVPPRDLMFARTNNPLLYPSSPPAKVTAVYNKHFFSHFGTMMSIPGDPPS